MVRDLAERDPDCAATAVVPAVLAYAVTAAAERPPDHSTPGIWVVPGKGPVGAHLPLTAVTADNLAQRESPAGMKAEKNAGHQAAFDFFSGARRAGHDPAIQDLFPVCTLIHAALR
jgi:hypothetical protein